MLRAELDGIFGRRSKPFISIFPGSKHTRPRLPSSFARIDSGPGDILFEKLTSKFKVFTRVRCVTQPVPAAGAMAMATVKVPCVSFRSQLKKRCLLYPQRSFSALKSATRTATPPSTSKASTTSGQASATTSSNASRKSSIKNEKKAKKALTATDSTEAQLKQIESMMNMANTSNLFPTMDMWGTKLVTLGVCILYRRITQAQFVTHPDVEIPRDASLRMLFTNPGAFWHAKQHNFSNWLKNTFRFASNVLCIFCPFKPHCVACIPSPKLELLRE